MSEPSIADRSAVPLSVAQEALWYISRLAPSRISYNETISIRKDGEFDAGVFRRAFNEIVRRHQAWHTTFDTVGGQPVQVQRAATWFALPLLDLSGLDAPEAERRAVAVVAEASRVPYDLRRGPLLRPRLIRFPGADHRLYLGMHHIVFDGVSVYRVVLPELVAVYDAFSAGRPSPLPEPAAAYADYARWEQTWIGEPRVRRRLEYWGEHLEAVEPVALPLDHPRPAAPRFSGGVAPVSLAAGDVDRLRELGQSAGATLFQVLASVWALVLSRYAGQDRVVFATAADLRQRPEFEAVVGYCLTPLVLRLDLSGDPTVAELVRRARNELLDGLDHLVPFERVVRELAPGGDPGANPLYQTMIVLEPKMSTPDPDWSIHQMEGEIGEAVGATKLDLELELDERPEGHISGRLIYDRDLFDASTATRLAGHWGHVAAALAADPGARVSDIALLDAVERRRLLVEFNATVTQSPPESVADLVRGRAELDPDAPAVSAGGETVSYGELERRAGRVARRLLAAGVGEGAVVAVSAADLTVSLVAGLLGVLNAGAAYLLLDPALPETQREAMIADAGAVAVPLDDSAGGPDVGSAAPDRVDPDSACLVQYLRGPDGEALGVPVSHAAVANSVVALAAELGLGPADNVLALPSAVFAASAADLWLALAAGARIVIAPPGAAGDGAHLARLMSTERVTFMQAPPTTWQRLIDTGLRPVRGLRALSGGGPLSAALAEQILERCQVLWNAYGKTETAGYCTLGRVEAAHRVTLGRPLANTRVYVVDGHGQPTPVGVTGELLVAGVGVAGGYLNRPAVTASAFGPDPSGDGIAHRTGDRVRWREDGTLEAAPLR